MKGKNIITAITDAVGDSLENNIDITHVRDLLIRAAAEELQAWYQYISPTKFAVGPERTAIVECFIKTAKDELDDHFDKIMQRLSELDADVSQLTELWDLRKIADVYIAPKPTYRTPSLILGAIQAEQESIRIYKEIIDYTKGKDVVTYDLACHILADEEDHLTNFIGFSNDLQS